MAAEELVDLSQHLSEGPNLCKNGQEERLEAWSGGDHGRHLDLGWSPRDPETIEDRIDELSLFLFLPYSSAERMSTTLSTSPGSGGASAAVAGRRRRRGQRQNELPEDGSAGNRLGSALIESSPAVGAHTEHKLPREKSKTAFGSSGRSPMQINFTGDLETNERRLEELAKHLAVLDRTRTVAVIERLASAATQASGS